MKRVKYYILARGIKAFLNFGFLFATIALIANLYIAVFNAKPYWQGFGGYSIGDTFPGYKLKAGMSINIPDTINYYKNGEERISSAFPHSESYRKFDFDKSKIQEQIINKIVSYESETTKISNLIGFEGDAYVEVFSKNKLINFFWASVEQINNISLILFFLLLIKLVNRYLEGEIFMSRSFRLVSLLGVLLIAKEILQFIVGMINMSILQHPNLHTFSTTAQKSENFIDMSFDFSSATNYSNIGIGIFIILLSQVLKEAILVKQESELTI